MNDTIIFILMGAFVCMMYQRSENYARGVRYSVGENGSVGPNSHCGRAELDGAARHGRGEDQTLERCKEICASDDSCVGFNTATCPGEECKEETNKCNFQGHGCDLKSKAGSFWYPVGHAKKTKRVVARPWPPPS
jgi:hypothetical protein